MADPDDLAKDLEGVIMGAEPGLTEEEIEMIGRAITYLRGSTEAEAKMPANAYAVLTADGEYTGHSGRKHLAERLARDCDDIEPEGAPHEVKEVSWDRIHEWLDGEASADA